MHKGHMYVPCNMQWSCGMNGAQLRTYRPTGGTPDSTILTNAQSRQDSFLIWVKKQLTEKRDLHQLFLETKIIKVWRKLQNYRRIVYMDSQCLVTQRTALSQIKYMHHPPLLRNYIWPNAMGKSWSLSAKKQLNTIVLHCTLT